ncbi:biotin--[acetyl-CoA-carboxylase] ligase [Krasilnikoviella flava]|uniref:biotin--[biotin carboxyl-carrier protein] ligase n=1 Tax=Krasilnikoviella flava TaxID=526729 RepID=A0A1T5JNR8_9MICO|nr:biotin--[acetyl-CoA-carboxylase] ligase [Krasilnikoviella flava]SKC53025.1 BirA family transcriptional regulator, biotin operon repressor / biotin-[acetyl-CoA-carboxylase] ligase [Krasilnikoviella flava]
MTRDPHRAPLDATTLCRDLVAPAGPLARLDVVDVSGSTNADLVEAVRRTPQEWPAPAALVAEHQVAGRGRAGRAWQTPPRAALTVSVLLRPRLAPARLGWLPLLAGLAVVRAVDAAGTTRAGTALKWPNDVLLPAADDVPGLGPFRKVAGVLAEVVPGASGAAPAVVVGVGLNVDQSAAELPVPTATSLALAGVGGERAALLGGLVRELVGAVARLEGAGGDAAAAGLAAEYAARSATLGTTVRAELAGGSEAVEGEALRVAADGALVIATPDGEQTVTAGDVHHLRRSQPGHSGR